MMHDIYHNMWNAVSVEPIINVKEQFEMKIGPSRRKYNMSALSALHWSWRDCVPLKMYWVLLLPFVKQWQAQREKSENIFDLMFRPWREKNPVVDDALFVYV